MSIAEQLTQTMEPLLDAVYAAGKAAGGGGESVNGAEVLQYATEVNQLFYKAVFPQKYEQLKLYIPYASKNLSGMFRMATGIKKLTLDVPTEQVYNASYFFYISTVDASTIEEISIPDGMKFSDFNQFARYCAKLLKIQGSIDLSETASTGNCFTRCEALQEVRFVPGTIKMSISFADCKNLSNNSIASIVLGLADLRGQERKTLTVSADVYNTIIRLSDEHETGDEYNEYDPVDKNWELVSGG